MSKKDQNLKLNVSSKMVEKGIDMAKNFVDSLIMPAIEETGLLIRDKVTEWRFNNQIKVLNKAKKFCEQNQINPKTISLKLLCPVLDYSGLEEEEYLQDKWALLLSNMVDSEQNIDNHVLPYLLSQISTSELRFLEMAMLKRNENLDALNVELKNHEIQKSENLLKLDEELKNSKKELRTSTENNKKGGTWVNTWQLSQGISDVENKIHQVKFVDERGTALKAKIYREQYLSTNSIQDYEIANMVRLGVIKAIQIPYATAKTIEIENLPDERYLKAEVEIDIEADYEDYTFTELGNLFIQACNIKKL